MNESNLNLSNFQIQHETASMQFNLLILHFIIFCFTFVRHHSKHYSYDSLLFDTVGPAGTFSFFDFMPKLRQLRSNSRLNIPKSPENRFLVTCKYFRPLVDISLLSWRIRILSASWEALTPPKIELFVSS